MARPLSNKVDYFPHFAKPGRTLFILESRFGNDGYAVWFKLLEILADADGHFYDASTPTAWQYLLARFGAQEVSVTEILDSVAEMGNIDTELWFRSRIIWCQNLVDNVSFVYQKRGRTPPTRPFCDRNLNNCDRNSTTEGVCVPEMRQSIVKDSIVEDSKDIPPKKSKSKNSKKSKLTTLPENFNISPAVRDWAEKGNHTDLDAHLEAFILRAQAKGYTYIDWDSAFKTAIRENWAKIGAPAEKKQASSPYGYDGEPEWMRRRSKGS